jgi:hypothetical protein
METTQMTPNVNKYSGDKPPHISGQKWYNTPTQTQVSQMAAPGRMRRFSPEEIAKIGSDGKL